MTKDGHEAGLEGSGIRELLSLCFGAWWGPASPEAPQTLSFRVFLEPRSLGMTREVTRPPIGD